MLLGRHLRPLLLDAATLLYRLQERVMAGTPMGQEALAGLLAEAGIDTSVGSVGDSYDNALAESIIGLFKTEVIKFLGPWKSVGQVEWETLKWVDWYNKTRLHSAIGYVTPNEAEEAFYASLNAAEKAA